MIRYFINELLATLEDKELGGCIAKHLGQNKYGPIRLVS